MNGGAYPDLFTEDYEYFMQAQIPPERTQAELELIVRIAELTPGSRVLDIGCGTGRIANGLARQGCRVTGIDTNQWYVDRARAQAAGPDVEFRVQDMRNLTEEEATYEAALFWFNTFGYFDDATNTDVLRLVRRALTARGVLVIEQHNRDWVIKNWQPTLMTRHGNDFFMDENTLDVIAGRTYNTRTYVRDGRVTGVAEMGSRLPAPSELATWLQSVGFGQVDFVGEDGSRLTLQHRRMIALARP